MIKHVSKCHLIAQAIIILAPVYAYAQVPARVPELRENMPYVPSMPGSSDTRPIFDSWGRYEGQLIDRGNGRVDVYDRNNEPAARIYDNRDGSFTIEEE